MRIWALRDRVARPIRVAALSLMSMASLGFSALAEPSRRAAPPPDLVGWRQPGSPLPKADRRPRLYLFTAEWCIPCRLLERDVFRDPAAAALIRKDFLPIKVLDRARLDGRNPPEVDALKQRFRVQFFPTMIIDRPGGGREVLVDYTEKRRVLQFLAGALPVAPVLD
jgi:thiol:disulfide interchange protein